MTVADSRKLLPGEYYPPWVVFARRQKLNWLNLIMNKIWPYVDEVLQFLSLYLILVYILQKIKKKNVIISFWVLLDASIGSVRSNKKLCGADT